jgi:glycosyltransferase involved in cell wall biosynthesis
VILKLTKKNEITIITPYYNNKDLLRIFITNFLKIEDCKLIIVDDGSMIYPAIDIVNKFSDKERISLYRIKKDLGFNAHGARNLGMTVSKTDWNLLTDSDIDPLVYNIETFFYQNLKITDVYSFTINSILVHKKTFFSCKGYDEDFVNLHYGDRFLLNYLENNFSFIKRKKFVPKLRKSWKLINIDNTGTNTTYYDEETKTLYQPRMKNHPEVYRKVEKRYSTKDFSDKKILNFEWEQLI